MVVIQDATMAWNRCVGEYGGSMAVEVGVGLWGGASDWGTLRCKSLGTVTYTERAVEMGICGRFSNYNPSNHGSKL